MESGLKYMILDFDVDGTTKFFPSPVETTNHEATAAAGVCQMGTKVWIDSVVSLANTECIVQLSNGGDGGDNVDYWTVLVSGVGPAKPLRCYELDGLGASFFGVPPAGSVALVSYRYGG